MKFFLIVLFFLLPVLTKAQFAYDNIFQQKLDNGLSCVVIENSSTPLVTIELVIKDGSAYETPEENGIAYLDQYFFFSANKDYPSAGNVQQRIKQLGAVTGNSIDEEQSSFYITLAKRNLDNGLKLMNSAARFPVYLEEDLQEAQKKALEEFQQRKASADYFLSAAMDKNVLGGNASRKNVMGDFKVITSVSPDKLLEYHKLFYTPQNSMIIVSGDVNHLDAIQKIQNIFGSWEKANSFPTDVNPVPSFAPLSFSSQFVAETPSASTPVILYSFIAPDLRNFPQMTYAAKIWSLMISSVNSPFSQAMTNSGLVQQVTADYKPAKFISTLNIGVVPDPAKMKDCLLKMNEEIKKFNLYDYYSDDLLNEAKQELKKEYAFSNEKPSSLSHSLGAAWSKSGINYFKEYEKNIDAVTLDDIINFINQFVAGKKMVTGLLISPGQRSSLQTDSYFSPTLPADGYNFTFTRNSGELFDIANKNIMTALIEFLKINPDVKVELIASQDVIEKKETANERFLTLYKMMEQGGMESSRLDAMKVSIYIRHGNTEDEVQKNMSARFIIQN